MNIIETNLKFNSNYTVRSEKLKAIVLHHAAADCTVQDVHRWHQNNGWAGIGYHFFVDKAGKIYRGRPENWIGAHTSGYNKHIGICAEGNFESDTMTDTQRSAIVELIKYLNNKYGSLKIHRHKDLDTTACPGRNYPFDKIVADSTKDTGTADESVAVKLLMLERGSCGNQVEVLQTLLNQKLKIKLDVDGDFGSKTEIAVKNYQALKELDIDGIVGQDTWGSLLGVS